MFHHGEWWYNEVKTYQITCQEKHKVGECLKLVAEEKRNRVILCDFQVLSLICLSICKFPSFLFLIHI